VGTETRKSNFREDMHRRSRGTICPRFAINFSHLSNERAQGMPDARRTRGLVRNVHKKMRTRAYRAAEAIRHSLRNGFTAYSALSPVIGLCCHRRP
jgi:hypothetical protein